VREKLIDQGDQAKKRGPHRPGLQRGIARQRTCAQVVDRCRNRSNIDFVHGPVAHAAVPRLAPMSDYAHRHDTSGIASFDTLSIRPPGMRPLMSRLRYMHARCGGGNCAVDHHRVAVRRGFGSQQGSAPARRLRLSKTSVVVNTTLCSRATMIPSGAKMFDARPPGTVARRVTRLFFDQSTGVPR
jgi:hypothetical protein